MYSIFSGLVVCGVYCIGVYYALYWALRLGAGRTMMVHFSLKRRIWPKLYYLLLYAWVEVLAHSTTFQFLHLEYSSL